METLTILNLLLEGLRWSGWLLAAGVLFILPGWGSLCLVWEGWKGLDWVEKLALSAGVSLAIHSVLVVWTNIIGLQLGRLYAWLPGIIGLVCIVWSSRRSKFDLQNLRLTWELVVTVIVIGLIFVVRFWAIRLLEAPSWGDSVQHSVLAQLFLDNSGLFQSWLPYAPYTSFSTHFGFSLHVALFSWLTGINSVKATLIVGQILNGIAVLGLYPLAMYISNQNRWAGIAALMVAGLFSPMPGFYVNWGRYAQLAGQAVLPAAMWMLVKAIEKGYGNSQNTGRSHFKSLFLIGVVLAGMVLNYFRTPFYFAAFVLAWLLGVGLTQWKLNWRQWGIAVSQLMLVGIVGILLFLPWGFKVSQNAVGESIKVGVATAYTWQDVVAEYQVFQQWKMFVPPGLAGLSGFGLAWSLVHRRGKVIAVGLWVVFLSSLVAARIIRLPGAALMQNFAVLIALYIPVGLVGGWLIGEGIRWLMGMGGHRVVAFAGVGVLIAAGWGTIEQRKIVDTRFVMVTSQDQVAMDWIAQNTPPDAVFLVESYLILNGASAVGADAGWWIPLLAGRANTMPPQYALWAERPIEPGYSQKVVELVTQIRQTGLVGLETIDLLCRWGITHAYIGQEQGMVGFGAVQLFSTEDLERVPFAQVYLNNRVLIYAFDRTVCGAER